MFTLSSVYASVPSSFQQCVVTTTPVPTTTPLTTTTSMEIITPDTTTVSLAPETTITDTPPTTVGYTSYTSILYTSEDEQLTAMKTPTRPVHHISRTASIPVNQRGPESEEDKCFQCCEGIGCNIRQLKCVPGQTSSISYQR